MTCCAVGQEPSLAMFVAPFMFADSAHVSSPGAKTPVQLVSFDPELWNGGFGFK